MISRFKTRTATWMAALAIAVAGLVPVIGEAQSAQAALDASRFNPGLIISDAAFYDEDSMTAEQIQNFLELQVPACRAAAGEPDCLKNYRTNSPAVTGETGICESMPDYGVIKASQLIYNVAQACGVSPRVILVMLQKEQGLVQSDRPLWTRDPSIPDRRYRFALGMDCPDTPSGCSASSAGFFWQLYKGIGQLNRYVTYPARYPMYQPGVRKILYQDTGVDPSCGRATVNIINKATTALYTYTPYTPNAAALTNLFGSGDSCSAYGNRNFWRFFSVWFGDPVAGSFMVTAADSPTYLIVNNQKIEIPSTAIATSYKPLGPVGKVSKDYLDSIPTGAGKLPVVVKNSAATPNYYVVDYGQKIDYSCTQIAALGLSCDSAIQLDANQLSLLPTVQPDLIQDFKGNQFALVGNSKYTISDPVTKAAFAPMLKPITVSGSYLEKFTTAGEYQPVVRAPASPCYFVHGGKRYSFTNDAQMAEFGIDCNKGMYVSSTVSGKLPIAGVLSEYVTAATGEQYLIEDGTKRQIFDTKSSQTIGLPALSPVSAAAFAWMPIGKPVIRDKILFASATTGEKILHLDGVAYTVADATATELSLSTVFEASSLKLPADALAPILADDPLNPIVSDPSGQQYILTSRGARRIEAGKSLTENATKVSANFIAAFTPSAASPMPTTVFVKSSSSATVYLVDSGVKRQLLNTADRTKFATLMTKTTIEPLSSSAIAQIPTGNPVITPGTFVTDSSTSKTYLIDTLSRAVLVPNSNQAALLGLPAPKAYSAAALKGYTKGAALKNNKLKCGTQTYLSISGSLYPIGEAVAAEYPGGALSLSDITCGNLVKSTKSAGVFIKSTGDNKIYFIEDGKKRLISGPNYLAKKQSLDPYVFVGPYFASLIPTGTPVADSETLTVSNVDAAAPVTSPTPTPSPSTATPNPTPSPSASATGSLAVGSFVQNSATKVLYLIDANLRAVKIANESQAVLLGLENPRVVSSADLSGYKFGAIIQSPKIKCGTQVYLTVTGTLYPISLAHAAEYAGGALTVSAEACAALTKSGTAAGVFIRTADGQLYQVENGTKRAITGTEYWSIKRSLSSPGFIYVGPYFASMMPTI